MKVANARDVHIPNRRCSGSNGSTAFIVLVTFEWSSERTSCVIGRIVFRSMAPWSMSMDMCVWLKIDIIRIEHQGRNCEIIKWVADPAYAQLFILQTKLRFHFTIVEGLDYVEYDHVIRTHLLRQSCELQLGERVVELADGNVPLNQNRKRSIKPLWICIYVDGWQFHLPGGWLVRDTVGRWTVGRLQCGRHSAFANRLDGGTKSWLNRLGGW